MQQQENIQMASSPILSDIIPALNENADETFDSDYPHPAESVSPFKAIIQGIILY